MAPPRLIATVAMSPAPGPKWTPRLSHRSVPPLWNLFIEAVAPAAGDGTAAVGLGQRGRRDARSSVLCEGTLGASRRTPTTERCGYRWCPRTGAAVLARWRVVDLAYALLSDATQTVEACFDLNKCRPSPGARLHEAVEVLDSSVQSIDKLLTKVRYSNRAAWRVKVLASRDPALWVRQRRSKRTAAMTTPG